MTIIFKYSEFYKYYTDPKNLVQLQNPIRLWYYTIVDRYNGVWLLDSDVTHSSITINNIQIYITTKNDWLFFNIPRYVNDKFMGDHISIGLKLNKQIIDMHFTLQNNVNGKAEHDSNKKCFLRDGMNIVDIINLPCQQPNGGLLSQHFNDDEIKILQEMLQKPFLLVNGGTSRYKYKNYSYKIRIGSKGGKFIIVKGYNC